MWCVPDLSFQKVKSGGYAIPESSAPRLKQKKVRLGFIAKELPLFELFLRNNSRNSRDRQVFWLFLVCG